MKYLPDWFPGAGFKRIAKEWKANLDAVVDTPYSLVQRQIKDGNQKPSYLSNIFQKTGYPEAGSEEELIIKWSAASLYTGGADTVWLIPHATRRPLTHCQTVSSIQTFFLAMTLYPEVQRKAQEEIDRVLGPGHLPRVYDRKRLPYEKLS